MTKIISFWGKGGTGKTTIAASVALGLSRQGFRVLALTSDPTPTLCETLLGRPCRGREELSNLSIIELSERDVIELWKKRFGDEVYAVVSAFLPVGREIIDYIAGAPGIADEFLMYLVYEEWRSGKYDYIVWDTPAAGNSIRLLRIEKEFYEHLTEAAKLYIRVKTVLDKIRRRDEADPLRLINEWRELASNILSMLASSHHHLHIVTIADRLGLAVTAMLLDEFKLHSITARRVIINKVLEAHSSDPLVEAMMNMQAKYLNEFSKTLASTLTCSIPFLPVELRGENLIRLWNILVERKCIDY